MSSLQCPHHHGPACPLTPQRHWAGSVCPLQVRLVWRLCWIRAGNQGAILATMPAAHGQIETKATNSTGSQPRAFSAKALPANRREGPAGAHAAWLGCPWGLDCYINPQQFQWELLTVPFLRYEVSFRGQQTVLRPWSS